MQDCCDNPIMNVWSWSRAGAFIHLLGCVSSSEICSWEVCETCYLVFFIAWLLAWTGFVQNRFCGHCENTHQSGGAMLHVWVFFAIITSVIKKSNNLYQCSPWQFCSAYEWISVVCSPALGEMLITSQIIWLGENPLVFVTKWSGWGKEAVARWVSVSSAK